MNYAFVGSKKWLLAVLLLAAGLAACQQPVETSAPTPTVLVQQIEIDLPTPSPIPATAGAEYRILPPVRINAPPPEPTPTPFTYKVKKDDTLLAIAIRHGITVEDLQAANPDVNARMLSIDTVLVIPLPTAPPAAGPVPQPTAVPVEAEATACYAAEDGGLWCFAPLNNTGSETFESISAWMTLYSEEGDVIANTQAALLLNILPPQQSLPLVVYLPGLGEEVEELAEAQIDLISAFALPEGDGRYITLQVAEPEVVLVENSFAAHFQAEMVYPGGRVDPGSTPQPPPPDEAPPTPPPPPPAVRHIWLAAVAYGVEGQIVGARRLEWEVELAPGDSLQIEGSVFSAGPPIARVVLVVEARP
jgi:LysM repeat protein